MCITVDKTRETRREAESKIEQFWAQARNNKEMEIDIWGSCLADSISSNVRGRLVAEVLSLFGFEAAYTGGLKVIFSSCFYALPKSCNTVRKAIVHPKAEIGEPYIDTGLGKLAKKMLETLQERRGKLAAGQHVWADWQKVANKLQQFDLAKSLNDVEKQEQRDLLAYIQSGLTRGVSKFPAPSKLLALGRKYPNFAEVANFVAGQFALARMARGGSPGIPPILLVGPPGTGKTLFAYALAKCLGTDLQTFDMSSQSSGFSLAGLDRGWANARAGVVFRALFNGRTLSQVMILDEIDKVAEDARTNPTGALYSLFEAHAAKRFVDEYAGFPVDASSIVWIATANDKTSIPEALRSRFVAFEIDAPSPAQMASVVSQIYRELVCNIPAAPRSLPKDFGSLLSGQTPRQARLSIQQALGRAVLRSASSGVLELCAMDCLCEPSPKPSLSKTGFGFLANKL